MFFNSLEVHLPKARNFFLFCVLFISLLKVHAQNEAASWSLGGGYQIDFQLGDANISSINDDNTYATICDKEGNLVLYTDGRTIWNSKKEVLINGNDLTSEGYTVFRQPIFVPYPKKDGSYFLIYQYRPKNGYNIAQKKMVYAEINSNAYDGRGAVITKDELIHENYHFEPTIAGFCDNSFYWLVVDRNYPRIDYGNSRDIINLYKIDENGVNLSPKIDSHFDIGNSYGYRFSPNGDKLYFTYQENNPPSEIRNVIADFNFLSGEFYNYRTPYLKVNWIKEFSPNSRFLYYSSGTKLMQVDAHYTLESKILKSASLIFDFASNGEVSWLNLNIQLAPDGRIYFTYNDTDGKQKLGRINKPNNIGLNCEIEPDIYTFNSAIKLPVFVTSFFRDKEPVNIDEQFPDAGPNLEICSKSSAIIGTVGNSETQYHWHPETFIEDPFSPQTVFKASLQLISSESYMKTLRATDGNCWLNFDETTITVLPEPEKLVIDGSWSVCPFVEEVDYWVEHDEDDEYDLQWMVEGGEIVSNPGNDTIKINWWETNSNAAVSVIATNDKGCSTDTSVFPIRINVELITETPKGPEKLCIAEGKNITYKIRNTNGSVYDWIVENGEVLTGQGTNEIQVNWKKEGIHNVVVKETSLTIDTICYGESDPLSVEIINDSLEIQLNNVSYISNNEIELNFESEKFDFANHYLQLEIENEAGVFQKEKPTSGTYYRSDEPVYSEILRLKVSNLCDEVFYSNPQQTIVLYGKEINNENTIQLNWNRNRFWNDDRLSHEIWHFNQENESWQMYAQLDDLTDYDFIFQGNSLFHRFRIKEINEDKNLESWSNIVEIEIDDELKIPDVFTPNGDGFNDVWNINNINFHPFKSVEIFNRLGQKVYECKNEFISWDGKIKGKIYQGTYFYQITFDSATKYGQITILQ